MNTCKIKIKKLTETAKTPVKANPSDTGYDIFVDRIENLGDRLKIHTGISLEIESGWWVEVNARSSVHKLGLILSNGVGVIDNGYRGEIIGIFYKTSHYVENAVKVGDKMMQMHPRKIYDINFEEVDELNSSDRGTNGFGSSGS